MIKIFKIFTLLLVGLSVGCATTIRDKHREFMAQNKGKVYYVTAYPFSYFSDKSLSHELACFNGKMNYRPSYMREAEPRNRFHAYGGRSSEESEQYAIDECERKFNKSCVILLTNGKSRCDATFDAAYTRAEVRDKQRRNLVEKKRSEDEAGKAEAMKSACIAFGFGPNTPQMSTCVMELFKTTAQVEAIRQASESQVQATSAALAETTRLLEFQQGMELLRQSNQMLAPVLRQNPSTLNCRYNTIMKTIVCN